MRPTCLPLLTLFLLGSCAQDEPSAPQQPSARGGMDIAQFALLSVGNYWVYEVSSRDSFGVVVVEPLLDSIVVNGQEEINGVPYYMVSEYTS
ncbi:MAG TPA: hypothetical protein PK760_04075, partial [Flavobacteriales bacterium]|nr:hypothetical protein [Flavobacteriales bacterium]